MLKSPSNRQNINNPKISIRNDDLFEVKEVTLQKGGEDVRNKVNKQVDDFTKKSPRQARLDNLKSKLPFLSKKSID